LKAFTVRPDTTWRPKPKISGCKYTKEIAFILTSDVVETGVTTTWLRKPPTRQLWNGLWKLTSQMNPHWWEKSNSTQAFQTKRE
jgi:hypothetical protein